MRTADAIWKMLARSTDTVFYLPGGGCGPLVDALGQSGLQAICVPNEQDAGWAAIGYAMAGGKLGVVLTTTGPGATNAITPCLAAWMDSAPVLFISGQVMRKWIHKDGMRSCGTQEGPTIELVRAITKACCLADDGKEALELARVFVTICQTGRRGPCWLDIPQDVQAEEI